MPSPAERYAAAKARQSERGTLLTAFADAYAFGLDGFQVEACKALEAGRSVLVAAPTGAGKTIVGEFAIELALAEGRKCFYTTPIKALSNQKFHDLVDRHGPERIGLLTGDTSVNSEAPIVVMTTEVLRNMLYAESSTLNELSYVVMDEVHYLADRFRGAVWEEVIIHLPASVTVAALSATVSNAEEFGAWLEAVRGDTEIIVEEHRPVPLWQHVVAGHRMYDLFVDDEQTIVNPELTRIARDEVQRAKLGKGRGGGRQRGAHIPWRTDVIERLEQAELLPAIYFLFSRKGCDDAVSQCLAAGLRLVRRDDQTRIRSIVLEMTRSLPDEDLDALGFNEWIDGLERGIAAHHAGMLPVFKEVVEHLFQEGLLKVVFATETLALGINMPARSVVLEKLVKWNGETHVDLTPGEYTQLTGRAGRRGIDVEGHAVVLWHQGIDPVNLAGLASTRTYPLRSSFQPSYNMAVNLVARMGYRPAREVLETSFAQFQADRSVVGLATQLRKVEDAMQGYRDSMTCHLGDFEEYARLRDRLSQREKTMTRDASARRKDAAVDSLRKLKPGDVISVPGGRRAGLVLVLDPGMRHPTDEPRPMVLTLERQVRRISSVEITSPVESIMQLRIPKNFNARNAQARRELAQVLANATRDLPPGQRQRKAGAGEDAEITEMRAQLRQHPCHGCDDREAHARWAERLMRAHREVVDLEQRINGRTNSVARRFDRVCDVLTELGYLEGKGDQMRVTEAASVLSRLYSESDLLAAQCIRDGIWGELEPADLAGVASAVVFESRKMDDDEPIALPRGVAGSTISTMLRIWEGLHEVERTHHLSITRKPDPGFAVVMQRWASGTSLQTLLLSTDITAGDFVRWTRQTIDLLGQIAQATAREDPLHDRAVIAADLLNRGVVSYSSQL